MKQYSYKGYKVVQYDDNDVEIKKNGKLEFHGQYTRVLSEFELYKVVDDYIKMLSKEPTTYDEALAQYLMEQGVVTEPCNVGDEVFFVELGAIKSGRYLAVSKNHIILTMHSLNSKPFDEQLKDMYENRYVKLIILNNNEAFLNRTEAENSLNQK